MLFTDDFENGNLSNWEIQSGAWSIYTDSLGNNWLEVVAPVSSDLEIQAGSYLWQDYEFEFDVQSISGVDKNIFFRVNGSRSLVLNGHNLPQGYGIHITNAVIQLQKWTENTGGNLKTEPIFLPVGTTLKVKVVAKGNKIEIFLNDNSTPIISYEDTNSPILSGRIAFAAITGSSAAHVVFDNVTVSSTEENLLQLQNFKQHSPEWGNVTYDHADHWSNNPTIERWGCALTSAAQVVNFHGHEVDPYILNEWLRGQPDGYLRNGLLNWLAVTRYTHQNSSPSAPSLEFSRLPSNFFFIKEEIDNQNPLILRLPGHFIVAKGYTENEDVLINDPATNSTLLSDLGATYDQINLYTPSNTDLSYILLVVDPNISIEIQDAYGNGTEGTNELEFPLLDDINLQNLSGSPLNTFMLAKPDKDTFYKIKLTGEGGVYLLDSYLYKTDGEVNFQATKGIMDHTQTDELIININDEDYSVNKVVSVETILNDWDTLWNKGLIYNKGLYKSVRTQLDIANKMLNSNKSKPAKKIIKTNLKLIKVISNKFLSEEAALITTDNLKLLLKNL